MRNVNGLKVYSIEEMITKHIGKRGTKERIAYDKFLRKNYPTIRKRTGLSTKHVKPGRRHIRLIINKWITNINT